ncbi:glycosyltransferase family 2 protein [Falsirhodobacter halotolerans]|uniref:glycosyltransferase family 2 protein n=1 Tax=Falsirhodobacter halotolerans TaxID=1146892 RepID=UPI001FD5DAE4|nr:galactosyltransferase-related protein [Falsirhodobacter halotolerans]MCJ8141243.1 galactosyltransferase-related protein [Falsirhodobacter halotolerans]
MPPSVSVLTIAKGRDAHLKNMMLGLARQTVPPVELIIAHMQDTPYADLPDMPFPVRQIAVTGAELPLARARNVAAGAASGAMLVFLDVDCIPGPTLIADYLSPEFDGLTMGEVAYLPGGATPDGWRTEDFEPLAVRHSDRQGPPAHGIEICEDYRCFWSLNFALPTALFDRVGGFDERFTGYGGEDTDFGKSLTAQGGRIAWIPGAKVYHQYHPHHMPPVHHLHSVVRNAELFAQKWGYRTMEHWLYAFMLMGLIDNAGPTIRILRDPDAEDIAFTRQEAHMPYANTRRILNLLKERHGLTIEAGSADPGQKALLRPAIAAE